MKSYSEYHKEQSEKQQLKIDKMTPEVRTDYFNRQDRIIEQFGCETGIFYTISKVAMSFSFFLVIFSVLLHSINTENSFYWFLEIGEIAMVLFILSIAFLPLSFIEYFMQNKKLKEELTKLDKKYNL